MLDPLDARCGGNGRQRAPERTHELEAVNRKLIFMLALVIPAAISTLLATLAVIGHLEVWHVALGNLVSGIMWSTEMSTRTSGDPVKPGAGKSAIISPVLGRR